MTPADGVGQFAVLLQRYRQAAGLSQEELAERAGLSARGVSDLERGVRRSPYPVTVRALARALLLAPARAPTRTSAWLYIGLGFLALAEGDPTASQAFLRQALTIARGVGDPRAVYVPLCALAEVARAQGDLARAEQRLEHAAHLIRAHGDLHSQCSAGSWLGHLALARGDLAQAASLQMESLAGWRVLGITLFVSHGLDELALVSLAAGDLPRAARLFGAAAGQRARGGGGGPYPLASAEREPALAAARQGLGEAAFEAAWRVGHELSLDEALADAEQLARQVGSLARAEANRRQVLSEQRRAVEESQLDAEAPDAAEEEIVASYTRQVRARLAKI